VATFTFRTASEPDRGKLRVAVKDLIDVAGLPTTNGSRIVAPGAASDGPVEVDAACMAGTRAELAAGLAVIVGKANMHELAFGLSGINPWYGTPVNPLDSSLVPGGSSSGSAVAVASGEADVAFGSDTGGSIRVPAACCGVVGLKTTRGRVPLEGVRPLSPSLDTVGPMAASVGLTARGMALLEPGFRVAELPARRVGYVRLPCGDAIGSALERSLESLSIAAGVEVSEVALPGWDDATTAAMTIMSAEAWQVHGKLWLQHADDLSPDVAQRLEVASYLGPDEVAAAWEQARTWFQEVRAVFEVVELIALPTITEPPPTIEHAMDIAEIRRTAPFNLSGHPALSMPVHTEGPHTEGGSQVPASLQLVAPHGGEAVLLSTAKVIEGHR
jgi:amidase